MADDTTFEVLHMQSDESEAAMDDRLRRRGVPAKLRLDDIQINETFWGKGAEERVKTWLREHYDERTMPPLVVVTIKGMEGYWLMGWRDVPSLLHAVFGNQYAEARLELNNADLEAQEIMQTRGLPVYGVTSRQEGGSK